MPYANKDRQRAAQRRHYLKNRAKYLARSKESRAARLEYLRKQKSKPCMDCGGSFPPYVMDFDHRPGTKKVAKVSTIARSGTMKQLKAEIKKCDLVCANCHRIRTHERRLKANQ